MARVQETPLMAAKDIVRSLTSAGKAFRLCEFARCSCGEIKKDCRQRWETWKKALTEAENKIAKLEKETE